ncbi:MAG TPA: DUF1036 domain-containing protein [Rhizomicrobium sp.]
MAVQPAHAALQICNQTSYVLYAATGASTNGQNVTQGWTRIVPGDCKQALAAPLTASHYFLYARSSRAHGGESRAWGGSVPLCAKDTNFQLKAETGAQGCPAEDASTLPFATLDTHSLPSWTATLTESNTIPSLDNARDIGLTRLLVDLGYKFTDRKGRDAALLRFRARMKMAANASNADLFDALETEAMKVVSPVGYTICNDTTGVVWAALAFHSGKAALSAGWWKISPGGCAHALNQPLTVDKVFVHAEGHGKPALVSGPDKFCIANITFQTSDETQCKAHGLSEAGFAATGTKGVTGFTAHIGDDGLIAPVQAGKPK